MITLKAYAEKAGITYEAVRQQIHRYADQLDGHLQKQGRTMYMDDEGEAILDRIRSSNDTIVAKDARIAELEQEVARLRSRSLIQRLFNR